MRGQCVMHHFQDERSKVKVTWVVSSFGPVRSVPLSLFDWITSYLAYINTWGDDVLRIIFRMTGQGHTGHLKFWPSPLHGFISIWLNHFICVAYIQHMRGRCVSHHFQEERSKVKVIWVIWSFYLVYSVASSSLLGEKQCLKTMVTKNWAGPV